MPNFRHIRPFMASLECPKIFGPFRVQDQVPRAQNQNFQKKKKKNKKKKKKEKKRKKVKTPRDTPKQ